MMRTGVPSFPGRSPAQRMRDAAKLLLGPWVRGWQKPGWERYLREETSPRLHVGCGGLRLPGWLNADRILGREVLYLDARRPLPFPDQSLDFIFSEHFINYLSLPEAFHFLCESYRTLRAPGVLRTATLGLELVETLLTRPEDEVVRSYRVWVGERFLGLPNPSPSLVVNHLFYGLGQKVIFSAPLLTELLIRAGFREIREVRVGHSEHPALRGVEGHGRVIPQLFNELETLVLEATR